MALPSSWRSRLAAVAMAAFLAAGVLFKGKDWAIRAKKEISSQVIVL
jgi:hypothetical protein